MCSFRRSLSSFYLGRFADPSRFSLFHLSAHPRRSSQPVGSYYPLSRSLSLSLSLPLERAHARESSIFPKTISLPPGRGNRPNADAAGAQPAEISPTIPGTYICYICNRKLYHADEINRRSRQLLRNAGVWLAAHLVGNR